MIDALLIFFMCVAYGFFAVVTILAVVNGTDAELVESESLWWVNFACFTFLWPVAWVWWAYRWILDKLKWEEGK